RVADHSAKYAPDTRKDPKSQAEEISERCYQSKVFCPIVSPTHPVDPVFVDLFRNPREMNTLDVYTNVPSYLKGPGVLRERHVLARLPNCIDEQVRDPQRDNLCFAVGGK